MSDKNKDLKRTMTLFPAIMTVVTCIIGSGIFTVPGEVMSVANGSGPNMAAWIIAGIACLLMAFVYVELAPSLPTSGGAYGFLRKAYGDKAAFFFGWSNMISHVSILAMMSLAFTNYLQFFFTMSNVNAKLLATALVIFVALINMKGLKLGSVIMSGFTVGKLVALGLVICAGVFAIKGINFQPIASDTQGWSTTMSAAVPAIFAFGGYNQFAYMSGEVKDPTKTIPKAILFGMLIVIAFNILLSVICTGVLGVSTLAGSDRAIADAAGVIFGRVGGSIVGIGALVSIFGSLNGSIMAMPRMVFAMANDKLLPSFFAKVHKENDTPYVAIGLYAVLAIGLLWSGQFGTLLMMGTFLGRILEVMVASTLYTLRKKFPDLPRPSKMWGYPFTYIGVIIITIVLAFLVPIEQIKMAIILASTSIPAYFIFKFIKKKETV
ncbi:MAG: APC family permease [Anaerorhabdus sp.]